MAEQQRTEAWFKKRAGKLTASRIAKALVEIKSGWGAGRKDARVELAIERLTGTCEEGYKSGPMQWGIDHEDEARMAYEADRGTPVTQVDFVDHPDIDMAGCSPDGVIYAGTDSHTTRDGLPVEGLIEIKCPNSATHIETIRSGKADAKYQKQIHWQMAVTGAQWVDFVSYDPRMPEKLQLKIIRVERDEDIIAKLEHQGKEFLREVDELEAELRRYAGD